MCMQDVRTFEEMIEPMQMPEVTVLFSNLRHVSNVFLPDAGACDTVFVCVCVYLFAA